MRIASNKVAKYQCVRWLNVIAQGGKVQMRGVAKWYARQQS